LKKAVEQCRMPGSQPFTYDLFDALRPSVSNQRLSGFLPTWDDWSSTAYWYQTLPSPVKSILPVGDRLPKPRLKTAASPGQEMGSDLVYSDDQRNALEAARERFSRYKAVREEHLDRKIRRTREYSRQNVEQSEALRDRYDQEERS
jgi:hypothetical protein